MGSELTRKGDQFQVMSRWVVWLDLRKAAAFTNIFDGIGTTDDVKALPGPPKAMRESALRGRRGVLMTAVEIQSVIKLFPAVQRYMDPRLAREARITVELLKSISVVDLMASLG